MYVTLMAIGPIEPLHPEDEPYLQYVVPAPPLPGTQNNTDYYRPTQAPPEQEPQGKLETESYR